MEDLEKNQLAGCCAIDAVVGVGEPSYFYHIAKLKCISHQLNHQHTLKILELNNDFDGASELCSLFLLPEYRQRDYGKLLSLSRLMYIANFPERFSSILFAEIRGHIESDGTAPFWEHINSKFFPLDFATADKLTGLNQKQFIAELMPRFPLYMDLLPEAARKAIGRPHTASMAAMQMLLDEGFYYRDYIDIFDGGPIVETFANTVRTVRESRLVTIKKISNVVHADDYLLSNTQSHFRVALAKAKMLDDDHIEIHQDTAKALRVNVGDKIRCKKF
jgi:arginine N-succinyltransferase